MSITEKVATNCNGIGLCSANLLLTVFGPHDGFGVLKEADHRYRNCDGYTQWAERTPLLIPGEWCGVEKKTAVLYGWSSGGCLYFECFVCV